MIIKNNSKFVVFLERQKLIIAGTQLATPLILEFPSNIVSDIDINDLEAFNFLMVNFFDQSKIIPSEVLLVISPEVYYEKNIALPPDPVERQKIIDIFLDTIPYKNLIYKDYPSGAESRIIALNKNFYEPIVKFIEKSSFNITAILPAFVLDSFHLTIGDHLPKEIKEIYQKYKQLEQYSLISSQDIDKISTTVVNHPKEDNSRAVILLIIFSILFVILLGFIYVRPRLMKPPVAKTPVAVPTIMVAPTPEIADQNQIEYKSSETIRIKVVNSSGITGQSSKIKQLLVDKGFNLVEISSSAQISATKNQISFRDQISPEAKQQIIDSVNSIAGESSEIELTDNPEVDVLITTTFKPGVQTTP